MRSYSFTTILLLCLTIIVVDILAFYWLLSITTFIQSDFLRNTIHILFWIFSIGLIAAILILKYRLDIIDPGRRQRLISSLYGLSVSSFLPKLLFVIIVSVMHFANYLFPVEESLIIIPVAGLLSGFIPFVVILYGIFRTLYRFKVQHVHIRSKNVPEGLHGLRIVQISDLHLGSFNYRYHILDRAITLINKLEPDLIFFTGDLVNNYAWELKGWAKVLSQLKARSGKYSILGNHDYGDYSKWPDKDEKKSNFMGITRFHQKIGFNLLMNESKRIHINGEELAIIGVENWGRPPFKQYGDLKKAMKGTSEAAFRILLTHDPTHWSEEVLGATEIELTLSGHTHGMQAGLKIGKKQWSPIKYKYRHWAGLYEEFGQYLYVNRGLGWMGFPGRLGVRPEITLIELHRQKSWFSGD